MFLCEGFLQLWQAGATLHRGARASSLSRPLLLRSTGSRRAGSAIVAHGPSCSAACGILPEQGSNLCPLHWQADSQPLRHHGSPLSPFILILLMPSSSLISLPSLSNANSAVSLFAQLTWNWPKGGNRLVKVDEGGLQIASVPGLSPQLRRQSSCHNTSEDMTWFPSYFRAKLLYKCSTCPQSRLQK